MESDPATEFRSWAEAAIRQLASGEPGRTSLVYGPSGKADHFRHLACRLYAQFRDRALAQAGLLHGIDPGEPGRLESIADIESDVRTILEERARLRSMGTYGEQSDLYLTDSNGPELSRQLVANVLPRIHDARAVVLFISEQIAELDVGGGFSEWTIRFPRDPQPPWEGFRLNEPRDRFTTNTSRAAFLRYIVSATAQFFGLWQERNIAENLALLHARPDRFNELVMLARSEASVAHSASLVDMIGRRLTLLTTIRWEWHHVAALDRNLGEVERSDGWLKRFDRTGTVVIECADEAACYSVLGNLHALFEYVPSALSDFIGRPQPSGYRAIHTAVVRRERRGEQDLVPIHIVPAAESERRFRLADAASVERIRTRLSDPEKQTIRVFAPDGRAYDLAPGSLVMNFAHAVHRDMLSRLRGATVNRRYVRPNWMLHDNDVVFIDLAESFQRIPDEWFEHLPESTRARLRRDYVEGSRPSLVRAGRRWLRKALAETGCSEPLEDGQLDALLEDVNARAGRGMSVRRVLRDIGLLDSRARGELVDREPQIDPAAAQSIAEQLARRIRESVSVASETDLPVKLRKEANRIEACLHCTPRSDEDLAVTSDGDTLIIHRRSASCAAGGQEIEHVRRVHMRQFFVVETSNRVGVAHDVLRVFQQHDVDIDEIAARRLGPSWGVVRVAVDFVSLPRQNAIAADLASIAGIHRIVKPDDLPIPSLEDSLPRRRDATMPLWSKAAPYLVGPAVEDDRHFYGMDTELALLEQAYQRVLEWKTSQFAFVTGPMRAGKTSLVKQFLRIRDRDDLHRAITTYTYASRRRWPEVSAKIRQKLLQAAYVEGDDADAIGPSLEEAIKAVRDLRGMPVILVIDEAVAVFAKSSENDADVAAIEQFHRAIAAMTGVLVVWIGPAAPVRRLDPRLTNILQSGFDVTIATLEEDDVARLLIAEKLGTSYMIQVAEHVSATVRQITEGNPFWVNQLAARMYSIARRETETRFDMRVLDRAKEEVLERRVAFGDRIPRTPLSRRIVEAMLRVARSPGRKPFDNAFLYDEVSRGATVDPLEFEEELLDLALTGTIVRRHGRWRIAAPLLFEFLLNEYGVKTGMAQL
jgi:hypothetical protein